MKKSVVFVVAACAAPMLLGASVNPVIVSGYDGVGTSFGKIPATLAFDGKAKIYTESYNGDSEKIDITIYDSNMAEVKSFSTVTFPLSAEGEWLSLGYDGGTMVCNVTQTLFNNDANYEYIMPKGHNGNACTGITVLSDNGSKVLDLDFPSGYVLDEDWSLWLLEVEGNYILSAELIKSSDDSYVYALYDMAKLKNANAKVAPVMVKSNRVRPTLPHKGEPIVVDLENPAVAGAMISVVDMDGTIVRSINIPTGDTSAEISTVGLSAGNYVVTVNNGPVKTESTRIILR